MNGPALIFDTECTGLADDREVIEAAWIRPRGVEDLAGKSDRIPSPLLENIAETFEQRYQPTKPIDFGAMAVHGILPGDLRGKPASGSFELPAGVEYLVGHSIDFDWHAIGRPDVKRIDTYAIATHLYDGGADSFSQSALLYMLRGAVPATRELLQGAHSAFTDVRNNALLLQEILEAGDVWTWSELYKLSEACRIPLRMPLGQAQGIAGMKLDEAVEADLSFVFWCLRQDWLDDRHGPYLRIGLEQAIERYRNNAEAEASA